MVKPVQKTQITVPCSTDQLDRVRKTVSDTLRGSRISGRTAREIVAGVDEVVSEVMIRSDVLDMRREVDLEISLEDHRVQVRIRNDGPCFDPEATALEGALPSLGVELIRKVFHDIRHSYADEGTNHLVLTRNLMEAVELEAVN
jgi:anti-sigma regulatory factor (Ser/Thr protein kinase)